MAALCAEDDDVSMYEREKRFHLTSLSFAVLIVMIAYYAIAAFHLPNPVALLRQGGLSREIIIYATACYLLIFLLGFTGKMGMILAMGASASAREKVIGTFITISFYLALIGCVSLTIALIAWRFSVLISSGYWEHSHFFWVAVFQFLFFSFLGFILKRFGLFQWKVLADLKAIPIVSPVFCLGAPWFFAKNLESANVDSKTMALYSALMFIAAALFLLYWVVFAVFNHRYTDDSPDDNQNQLVSPDGRPLGRWPKYRSQNAPISEKPVYITFSLFAIAMYLSSVVVLDVVLVMARHAVA